MAQKRYLNSGAPRPVDHVGEGLAEVGPPEGRSERRRALEEGAREVLDKTLALTEADFTRPEYEYAPLVEWEGLWLAKWQVDRLAELGVPGDGRADG